MILVHLPVAEASGLRQATVILVDHRIRFLSVPFPGGRSAICMPALRRI
jgi:hypothetical protein